MKTLIKLTAINQYLDENRATVVMIQNKRIKKMDLLAFYQNKSLLHKLPADQLETVCCTMTYILQENSRRQIEAFKAGTHKQQ